MRSPADLLVSSGCGGRVAVPSSGIAVLTGARQCQAGRRGGTASWMVRGPAAYSFPFGCTRWHPVVMGKPIPDVHRHSGGSGREEERKQSVCEGLTLILSHSWPRRVLQLLMMLNNLGWKGGGREG